MDRGQRRGDDPRFRRIVETAQVNVIRNGNFKRPESVQKIDRHKIIRADKDIRQFFQVPDAVGQVCLIFFRGKQGVVLPVLGDAELLFNGKPEQVHGIAVHHIPFEERPTVQKFSDKSDPFFPSAAHFSCKCKNIRFIIHRKEVCFQRISRKRDGRIHEQDRNIEPAQHFTVFFIKNYGNDILIKKEERREAKMNNIEVTALGELLIDFTENGVSTQGNWRN